MTPSSRSHEWDYWSSSGDMFIYPANGVGGYHDNFIDTFFDWLLHLIERLGQGATSELLFRGSGEPPPINVTTTNPGDAIDPATVVTDGVEESGAMPIPSPLAQAKPPPAKSGASSSLHPQLLTIRYRDNILHYMRDSSCSGRQTFISPYFAGGNLSKVSRHFNRKTIF